MTNHLVAGLLLGISKRELKALRANCREGAKLRIWNLKKRIERRLKGTVQKEGEVQKESQKEN